MIVPLRRRGASQRLGEMLPPRTADALRWVAALTNLSYARDMVSLSEFDPGESMRGSKAALHMRRSTKCS
jgi:hypothetical protein